ncbi:phosphodiesterase [Dyella tabacisoli]|uniref:Phosphodiesterase n=2 Tax=Dyella tabacisoli TaxID=2282381 RepID=A0A369UVY1_9GAMM|nr:phosphodiesterase [Dyella tabacisoli]
MPLAYALAAVIGLILALTWGALQLQVALAGFLNGESVWSKAQKQAVIDLDAYAFDGDASHLASFRRNYTVLQSDRWARDAIAGGHFDKGEVTQAFRRGDVIPSAIPGMIFMLQYFPDAPYMGEAMSAWRSVDDALVELDAIATKLQYAHAHGQVSTQESIHWRERIQALNNFIEPRANSFSVQIAQGAAWLGRVLFGGVLATACLASLLWLRMARRILTSIRGTEERYRLLFDSAADAIVMVDENSGRILDANRTAATWTGRESHELVGQSFADLFARGSARLVGTSVVSTLQGLHGQTKPVETHSSLATWGAQSVRQAIIRDISERIVIEQERRIAAEALASVAEGVVIADAERKAITVNAAYTRLTGYTLQALQYQRIDDMRRLPDGRPLPESVWSAIAEGGNWFGEVQSRRIDGSTYPEWLSISAIRNSEGEVLYYVAVFTDITATKTDRQRLEYLATHDALTGLSNRAEFQRQCTRAIEAAAKAHGAVAVLFVDLDAFKVVNDSYSHAIGDRLLVEVAERISRELRENDVAGRIGGDEFTVLLSGLRTREEAGYFANRLLASVAEPLRLSDYEITLSASIGIAGYPLDGNDPIALIANADAAMYAAKTEERNTFRFYTPMMHADARKRLLLGADLRQALARDEFYLVYQPSIELRSGRVVAVEALLRWRHPTRGELLPDEFIPLAESLGLIRRIDSWTMQNVREQIRRWDLARLPPLRVAMNVSASTFGHPSFVDDVKQAVQTNGLPAKQLLIEITESAILRLGEDTERTMHALHALGIGVAIDDFGTGYSSLAYLKLSAVDYFKIDRSFVSGLPGEGNDVAIVEAMLAIAKSLGIGTIAEGIETKAQHDFLLRAGCGEGQGYLYARPLAASEIERMLLTPNARPGATRLRLVPPE